jgi:hypothetical protein
MKTPTVFFNSPLKTLTMKKVPVFFFCLFVFLLIAGLCNAQEQMPENEKSLKQKKGNDPCFEKKSFKLGFRLGAGAQYHFGAWPSVFDAQSAERISWLVTTGINLRFNVNKHDRGTAIGAFFRVGNHNAGTTALIAEQQKLNIKTDDKPFNLYADLEFGFLINDLFRLSGGVGWQGINAVDADNSSWYQNFQYGVATAGFTGRFGRFIEMDINLISNFAIEYEYFALNVEICLVYHISTGKVFKLLDY